MQFVVPLYGGRVVLLRSRDQVVRAHKRLGAEPPDDLDRALGYCRQLDADDGRVVYLVGWFTRDLGTLVHECVHLAQFILIRAGIDPRDSNGETMAYLTDELFARLKSG